MKAALIKSNVVVAIVGGIKFDSTKGWIVDGGTSEGTLWTPPSEYGPIDVVEAGNAELGWIRVNGVFIPPGISLDAALAEVDMISEKRLMAGATHRGVRFPLDLAARTDWIGLLVLAPVLPLPVRVVGTDGALNLTTVAEVQAAAGELALYRLSVQRRSAETRELLAAAADDQARAAIVAAYREDS